uniref:ZP domain-containing protein n=1 Tax=Haemonchus placei TaxID=6290 RepID=A0A0N4W720_HAEPC
LNVAVLKLPLKDDHCGVRYNKELDQYVVTVEIHSHSIVIVDEDVVLNVTCHGSKKTFKKQYVFGRSTQEKLTMSVRESDNGVAVREVLYTKQYTLAVTTTSNKVNFRVGNCSAQCGDFPAIKLSDSRGCSLYPSLLTNFTRTDSGWYAYIFSAFPFPSGTEIIYSCQVTPCREECQVYTCGERNSVSRRSGTEGMAQVQSLHTAVLLRHQLEETTWMQPYEMTTEKSNNSDKSDHSEVMCTLCIVLSGELIFLNEIKAEAVQQKRQVTTIEESPQTDQMLAHY